MFVYSAFITSVYDGDTVTADVDLGFHTHCKKLKFRLFGIDAPEIRGATKIKGRESRDFLRSLVLEKEVTIKSHKDSKGKYGRYLCDLYVGNIPVSYTHLTLPTIYSV